MGGVGSGPRVRSRRLLIDRAVAVDVARWSRVGLLAPGKTRAAALAWGRAGSAHQGRLQLGVAATLDGGTLAVTGTAPAGAIAETVALTTTPQPFGGVRWWCVCPGCGARRRVLYLAPGWVALRCRACLRAVYPTQRMGQAARWERRAARLRTRVGGVHADGRCFPPPGMHRATFDRLMDEADTWERAACGRRMLTSGVWRWLGLQRPT